MTSVEAPIAGVTVYPGQARVTRRATVELGAGQQRVEIGGLPMSLQRDSVRVSGQGEATVLGVDVVAQRHSTSPDATVTDLLRNLREMEGALRELEDNVAIEDGRAELLGTLRKRSGATFAKALAKGEIEPDRIAGLTDTLASQLALVLDRKRELAEQRVFLQEQYDAMARTLASHQAQQEPDRQAVRVDLQVAAAGSVDIELSYVVDQAHWSSTYDIRVTGEALSLTWHGEITQNTGEDWPECELQLSTARPSVTATVPELTPWFLDRLRPVPAAPAAAMESAAYGAVGAMPQAARMRSLAPAVAEVDHGAAATTYRPTRPVAVPSDGSAHRTTVAVIELDATVDHITAPIHGPEAFLRATAVNSSEHTLRPGKASVFHESEFVGTTSLDVWSPSEEVELNLGIDDRIRVERELVRRTAGKSMLGSSKRREAAYRIKIGNYGRRATKVTVLDQIPVSRDDGIKIKDVTCKPDPAERTDLGELTWKLPIEAGQTAEISVGFRVDVDRGVEMTGWRE